MNRRESAVPAHVEDQAALRRIPIQRRSRERVERMLSAATSLIAEKGSEAISMSEVASRAGVSIGSLYQYFPDKLAIIRTLAERYNEQGRAYVEAELADVREAASLHAALSRLVDGYYAMFLAEPVMRDIWSGTQAAKVLQDINLDDIRANAALIADAMKRSDPSAGEAEVARTAFLATHIICSTVRLAVSLDRTEGDQLIAAFKRLLPRLAFDASAAPS